MKKPNHYYRILVAAYSLSTFSEGILMPIYAVFVQKVGGGILDAAGAVATFFIVMGIAEWFIFRRKFSHTHRLHLMVGGWIVWLLGIFMYLIIRSVPILFLAQILTALGNAIADPAFDAELAERTDVSIKEYEYGTFEASKDIFQGIAALIGGLVVFAFGFHILVILMVISATVSFFLIVGNYWRRMKKEVVV
jgi:MFS transporter